MLAVARLVAHKLRARWRGWAALAAITAIAGGAVLAGAIRTDTAYPRFLAASNASDVLASPAGPGLGGYDAALGRLPGVAASAAVVGINAVPVNASGVPGGAVMTASLDGRYGRDLEIPKMLAGRLPGPDAPGEIAVDQLGAQQLNLHVGSVLPMAALDNSNHARPFTEHVVGVFVTRGSVVPVTDLDRSAPPSSSPPAWSPTSARTPSTTTPASTPPPRSWPACWRSSAWRCSPSSSSPRPGAAAATSPC
jgi:hypothetical protein